MYNFIMNIYIFTSKQETSIIIIIFWLNTRNFNLRLDAMMNILNHLKEATKEE